MTESTNDVLEVSYKDLATTLFLAIEEMEWRDAFDIIASDPKQARTWVNNNSGAESTPFNSWRRLPIHEVRSRIVQQYKTCLVFSPSTVRLEISYISHDYHSPSKIFRHYRLACVKLLLG